MKAIINAKSEVKAFGENIAEGNTWVEVTATPDDFNKDDILFEGCFRNTIDEAGVVTRLTDQEIEATPDYAVALKIKRIYKAAEYQKDIVALKSLKDDASFNDIDDLDLDAAITKAKALRDKK